ncbi:hypothetical protein [Campylobacter sp. RM16192]|uniref:hypothetical protein n=1 Tax=Campylobacter sp. RM16192 TaxID=1660080 RepID=UPI00145286F9|nr:hypothetical protein [Campylobacter sp. RM16192]QCD51683.1 hypothetical protein CDOMC_0008 [Campylobacter sp. RM16192]
MGVGIKSRFLSFFREFFVYHHRSLEFRAKVFAAIIAAKLDPDEDDFIILYEISKEIYDNDEDRKAVLIQITKEYISKVKCKDHLTLDTLLLSIDQSMKSHKRYASKIDFSHLRRLINGEEEETLIQQRVYDFLLYEVKQYSSIG